MQRTTRLAQKLRLVISTRKLFQFYIFEVRQQIWVERMKENIKHESVFAKCLARMMVERKFNEVKFSQVFWNAAKLSRNWSRYVTFVILCIKLSTKPNSMNHITQVELGFSSLQKIVSCLFTIYMSKYTLILFCRRSLTSHHRSERWRHSYELVHYHTSSCISLQSLRRRS